MRFFKCNQERSRGSGRLIDPEGRPKGRPFVCGSVEIPIDPSYSFGCFWATFWVGGSRPASPTCNSPPNPISTNAMGRTRLHLPSRRITAHVVTKVTKEKVKLWAEVGTEHQIIANELGISVPTLRKYYGVELAEADARGVAKVAASLYAKALKGDVAAMTLFLRKRGKRLGWGDDPGENAQTTNILQLNLVKSITQAVSHMRQQGGEAAQMLIEADEVMVLPSVEQIDAELDDAFDLVGRRE